MGPIKIPHYSPSDVQNLISNIINMLIIGISLAAFIAIIYGGYLYISAGGNAEQAGKGKNAILGGVFGMVIAFAAYIIVHYIIGGIT